MWKIKMTFIQPTICSIDVTQDSQNKIKYNYQKGSNSQSSGILK